jgi:hypothetical protein
LENTHRSIRNQTKIINKFLCLNKQTNRTNKPDHGNISVAENTKILLVYATYGYIPEAYRLVVILEIDNQVANLQVVDLKVFYKELVVDLVFFTKRVVLYYDKYYSIKPTLKKRDKIYLIQRNIQIKRLNIKLDHKKLGLFKIKRITRLINYKLALPRTVNIHPVFHISLLEPALLRVLPAPVTEIEPVNPNIKYEIKEILDYKRVRNYVKYLVK